MNRDDPFEFSLNVSSTTRTSMTEAEWLSNEGSGWLLEYTKRNSWLTPLARNRKYRLAAIEIVRQALGTRVTSSIARVIETAESMCENQTSLRDVASAIHEADSEIRADLWSDLGELLGELGSPDAFSALNAVALFTWRRSGSQAYLPEGNERQVIALHCRIIREIFGNPFRPVTFDAAWRTSAAVALATQMYESREFGNMPILADALEDAGCDNADIIAHCRDPHLLEGGGALPPRTPHVRGCWVVDLVLGRA
jgi:hypothetical protein